MACGPLYAGPGLPLPLPPAAVSQPHGPWSFSSRCAWGTPGTPHLGASALASSARTPVRPGAAVHPLTAIRRLGPNAAPEKADYMTWGTLLPTPTPNQFLLDNLEQWSGPRVLPGLGEREPLFWVRASSLAPLGSPFTRRPREAASNHGVEVARPSLCLLTVR